MKFNTSLQLPFYGPFCYAPYGRSLRAHVLPFSRDFIKIPTIYAANHENQMLQFSKIKMKISTLFMVSDRAKNPGGPTTDKAKRCYQ